jgi:hypothetical protein
MSGYWFAYAAAARFAERLIEGFYKGVAPAFAHKQ